MDESTIRHWTYGLVKRRLEHMNTTTQHSSTASRPFALLATVRDELRERRQVRAAHRSLERELSSYNTRAEVDDLLAVLEGQDSAEADVVRSILTRNLQQRPTGLLAS